MQSHAALEHGQRVQRNAGDEQKIIHPFVPAKTFAPEKNRINRARSVNQNGEQKTMPVSVPIHAVRLNAAADGASGKFTPPLALPARCTIVPL